MPEAPIVVQPVSFDACPASPMAHVQLRPPIVVQPVSEDSLKGSPASPMAVAHVQLRPNKPVSLESQMRRPFPLEQTLGASQAKSTSFLGTKAESTAHVRVARLLQCTPSEGLKSTSFLGTKAESTAHVRDARLLQCTSSEGLGCLRARCDGLFVKISIALIPNQIASEFGCGTGLQPNPQLDICSG